MGRKHEITHTQTFFPESLYIMNRGRSPGLRLFGRPSHRPRSTVVCADAKKLFSLQLRVQLVNLTVFL